MIITLSTLQKLIKFMSDFKVDVVWNFIKLINVYSQFLVQTLHINKKKLNLIPMNSNELWTGMSTRCLYDIYDKEIVPPMMVK